MIIGISARLLGLAAAMLLPAGVASAQDAFGSAAAIAEGDLGRIAGREDINSVAQANQASNVSNNSVNGNSVTGAVQIDGQAFQNLQGLSVINANSGNNVSINAAMNVTIAITAMP